MDLKRTFTSDQVAFGTMVGDGGGSLSEKILKLFSELPDPLLSEPEIKSLLGTSDSDDDYCCGKPG